MRAPLARVPLPLARDACGGALTRAGRPAAAMAESGLLLHEIAGMDFRPVTRDWVLSGNLEMNYIAFAKRVVAAEEGGGPGDGGAPQQGGGGGEEAGGRRAGANEAAPA